MMELLKITIRMRKLLLTFNNMIAMKKQNLSHLKESMKTKETKVKMEKHRAQSQQTNQCSKMNNSKNRIPTKMVLLQLQLKKKRNKTKLNSKTRIISKEQTIQISKDRLTTMKMESE